ncbi:MAG: hypothetical protein KA748_10315 [Halomonas sp.]|nr:glycosyltransferase [Halomonas sp.]MBP5980590.1 hypothetical protein [Halomonas sp.]
MKKHIFVMIRYSALTESSSAWAIGRNKNFESYREMLFSNDRLTLHEKLFREVTLPSLKNMDKESTTVLIFTSDELPFKYMNNLNEMVGDLDNFKVVLLPRSGKLISQMHDFLYQQLQLFEEDVCYATVRVDDDDALSNDFGEHLFKYVDPVYQGHAISFPVGVVGFFNGEKYIGFNKRKTPLTALGLSFINVYTVSGNKPNPLSIYGLGKHSNIDERYPVVMISKKIMYIRTMHEESDVYSMELKKKFLKGDEVSKKDINNLFAVKV